MRAAPADGTSAAWREALDGAEWRGRKPWTVQNGMTGGRGLHDGASGVTTSRMLWSAVGGAMQEAAVAPACDGVRRSQRLHEDGVDGRKWRCRWH